jgi:uncharacterized protein YndB with AHSA1/START domain
MPMKAKKIEFRFEKMLPAQPRAVFDAWLNPNVPGNPWHEADKLILSPKVEGFFYWLIRGTAHYGMFTEVSPPSRIKHTWVSPSTLGEESTVTLTFDKHEDGTRMTLVHSNLPDDQKAKGHEQGWNYFLGLFSGHFAGEA